MTSLGHFAPQELKYSEWKEYREALSVFLESQSDVRKDYLQAVRGMADSENYYDLRIRIAMPAEKLLLLREVSAAARQYFAVNIIRALRDTSLIKAGDPRENLLNGDWYLQPEGRDVLSERWRILKPVLQNQKCRITAEQASPVDWDRPQS